IMFLPPYSPELDPVEEAIPSIKSWIRCINDHFTTCVDGGLYDLREVLDVFVADDADGYIRQSSY
ncbi:hypothetical protein DFJ58DRAFT_614283, partial [Suillus subalutaceus]|uniref:uncharacterized protein n=1 Tax=Suillus subalutaceus TaxID=48586 RepID=UPI001B8731D5